MAALELTGCPYLPVEIDLRGDRTALQVVSAAGKVPVLQMGDMVITQSVAIIDYLAGQYPDAHLLPADLILRADALSRMAWLSSHLHVLRRQFFVPMLLTANENAQQALRRDAEPKYHAAIAELDSWFDGIEQPLAVATYAMAFCNWAVIDSVPIKTMPNLMAVTRRLANQKCIARAMKIHRSPLLDGF
jgi:glutathione S-transferase